jgi:hypothetical protein
VQKIIKISLKKTLKSYFCAIFNQLTLFILDHFLHLNFFSGKKGANDLNIFQQMIGQDLKSNIISKSHASMCKCNEVYLMERSDSVLIS